MKPSGRPNRPNRKKADSRSSGSSSESRGQKEKRGQKRASGTQRTRSTSNKQYKRRYGKPGKREKARRQPKERTLNPNEPIRLNRYIAMAGVCARRKADELISAGKVQVNGEVVKEMGVRVGPGDVVVVNGERITPLDFEYVLLNKPRHTITSKQDERGRRIVLDLIEDPGILDSGVFPVGRLDRDTVGVLLITNDGDLAHRLMHPSYEVEKLYQVHTKEAVTPHQIDALKRGVTVEDETMRVDEVAYLDPANHRELGISLHEGKNRQIRRMLESLGHEVAHLERIRYAGLTTEGVRRGKWRRLKTTEIRRLRRLVKLK